MVAKTDFNAGQLAASGQLAEMIEDGRVQIDTLVELADWWKRWYMEAGHKRLGRVVMLLGKPSNGLGSMEGENSDAPDNAG